LLTAAARILDESGDPSAVTIRGVAAAVGVAPNAVYLHFASRQALLVALVAERFAAFGDHIRGAIDAAGLDPVERVKAGHRAYIDFALAHHGHYRLMFGDDAGEPAVQIGLDAFELCVGGCRELAAAGLIGDVDPERLAASLWAFDHGYVELARTAKGRLLSDPDETITVLLAALARP
jgi:AcrR family transcriptional regulator